MVEHPAVNRRVVGSNPTRGAVRLTPLQRWIFLWWGSLTAPSEPQLTVSRTDLSPPKAVRRSHTRGTICPPGSTSCVSVRENCILDLRDPSCSDMPIIFRVEGARRQEQIRQLRLYTKKNFRHIRKLSAANAKSNAGPVRKKKPSFVEHSESLNDSPVAERNVDTRPVPSRMGRAVLGRDSRVHSRIHWGGQALGVIARARDESKRLLQSRP